jgi:DNA modification methylase
MGKSWDYDVPKKEIWEQVYRVLKPGAHLLAFFGSRTYHRGVVQIEDAGFEIRDQIMWIYGSGFPKSHNIGKAIDKESGAEREVIGTRKGKGGENLNTIAREGKNDSEYAKGCGAYGKGAKQIDIDIPVTAPATENAKKWEGWGTALKPAHEPIVVARKPISQKNIAANVLKHGTGALNIDGCRVAIDSNKDDPRLGGQGSWKSDKMAKNVYEGGYSGKEIQSSPLGRWPANVIHDGSDGVVSQFPQTGSGNNKQPYSYADREYNNKDTSMFNGDKPQAPSNYNDNGSAARFFYCAKASKVDRDENNNHPTVKPTDLMKYLCRLVTPKGGTVLDPFMGSGTTGKAALQEGFKFVGIEMNKEYFEIANIRIKNSIERNLFDVFFESNEKVT